MALQSTVINGAAARLLAATMAFAITSLPAPDSPRISTDASVGAIFPTYASTSRMAWETATTGAGLRVTNMFFEFLNLGAQGRALSCVQKLLTPCKFDAVQRASNLISDCSQEDLIRIVQFMAGANQQHAQCFQS